MLVLCVIRLMQDYSLQVIGCKGAPDSCLEASRDPHRKRLQAPTPAKVCNFSSAAWKYDRGYHRQHWIRIAYLWWICAEFKPFWDVEGECKQTDSSCRDWGRGTRPYTKAAASRMASGEQSHCHRRLKFSLHVLCSLSDDNRKPDVHILCEGMI